MHGLRAPIRARTPARERPHACGRACARVACAHAQRSEGCGPPLPSHGATAVFSKVWRTTRVSMETERMRARAGHRRGWLPASGHSTSSTSRCVPFHTRRNAASLASAAEEVQMRCVAVSARRAG